MYGVVSCYGNTYFTAIALAEELDPRCGGEGMSVFFVVTEMGLLAVWEGPLPSWSRTEKSTASMLSSTPGGGGGGDVGGDDDFDLLSLLTLAYCTVPFGLGATSGGVFSLDEGRFRLWVVA
jgi:hypothetical protein